MATQTKTQLITEIFNLLRRRYKPVPPDGKLSVLEAVVYGICHEGVPRATAERVMDTLRSGFFDWNEVRVSLPIELEEALTRQGLPEAEHKVRRIRRFLKQLFDKTFSFTLEGLAKKPLKDAVKTLHGYEAGKTDFIVATVIGRALGGHAIPLDAPRKRALVRLGVTDDSTDEATIRATLERVIPKNKGAEFSEALEALVLDVCVDEPICPKCELRKICPTGQGKPPMSSRGGASGTEKKPAAKGKAATPPPPQPAPLAKAPSASASKPSKAPAPAPAPAKPAPPAKPAASTKPAPAAKTAPAPTAKPAPAPAKPAPAAAKKPAAKPTPAPAPAASKTKAAAPAAKPAPAKKAAAPAAKAAPKAAKPKAAAKSKPAPAKASPKAAAKSKPPAGRAR